MRDTPKLKDWLYTKPSSPDAPTIDQDSEDGHRHVRLRMKQVARIYYEAAQNSEKLQRHLRKVYEEDNREHRCWLSEETAKSLDRIDSDGAEIVQLTSAEDIGRRRGEDYAVKALSEDGYVDIDLDGRAPDEKYSGTTEINGELYWDCQHCQWTWRRVSTHNEERIPCPVCGASLNYDISDGPGSGTLRGD